MQRLVKESNPAETLELALPLAVETAGTAEIEEVPLVIQRLILVVVLLDVMHLRAGQVLEELGEGRELGVHLLVGVVVGVRRVPG